MKQLYPLLKKAKHSAKQLWLLNTILKYAIPFNRPHGFKVHQITNDTVTTYAPYCKKNFNHLKGIHACAIATVGELSAGLSLINHFSPKQYRFIMSHIEIDYHYQAKKDIFATSTVTLDEKNKIIETLNKDEKALYEVTTKIIDSDEREIATVKTIWQIKDWQKVKTKV